MRDEHIILAVEDGQIVRWDGHYGWVQVPPDEPYRINGAHRFKNRALAVSALGRMRRLYPRSRRVLQSAVYRFEDLWLDKHQLNLDLLMGANGAGKDGGD
jgi:hypothetical protein